MQCRLCRGKIREYAPLPPGVSQIKDNRRYGKCLKCGIIQVEHSFLPDREREKDRYLKHHNGTDNSNYLAYQNSIMEKVVLPLVERGSSILDIGCGPSPLLAKLLGERGFHVSVYDPFFFPDETVFERKYEAVTSIEVIEHLHHPESFFDLLDSLLTPDGVSIFQTAIWRGEEDHFRRWWYRQDRTHVTFYTPESITFIGGNWFSGFSAYDNHGYFRK